MYACSVQVSQQALQIRTELRQEARCRARSCFMTAKTWVCEAEVRSPKAETWL
jgi:hypothetical protein